MAWGKAGSTTLGSAGDALTTPTLSSNDTLQYSYHGLPTGGELTEYMTMGSGGTKDTGSNYANRLSSNGGSDSTFTSRANIVNAAKSGATTPEFGIGYILNIAGEEKLLISHHVNASANGAGTAPERSEAVGKHVQTSVVDDIISFDNTGSGDLASDSNLSALGSDITPAAAIPAIDNVQDNSLFVDKVNARRYWFDENPLVNDNFSSSTGWTQVTNTASGVSGGELIGLTNSSGTNGAGAWKDYGLVDDEKFVLRCKFQIVTQSGGSGNASTLYFGISDTNGATSPHSNRDGFGIAITNYAASGMLWLYPDGTTWDNADTDLSLTPTATTYYLEIARTSATSVTFKLFSDEYSTVVKTHTQTIASTLNGLRYIMFQEWRNSSGNTTKVAVDDLQIWNGVATASGGGEWTMNPTLEDDFSSSTGWTTVGSNISITGGAITASSMTTQSENRIHKPLGFTIADDFLIEFEFEETAISHGAFYMLFTLSAGSGNINNSTNQDAIQVWIDKGSPTFYLRDKDGTSAGSSTSALTISNSTRYYVTLVNNNRTVTYTVRTGSHTGTVLGTNSITLQSGTTGLTHIQSGSMTGNSGTTSYTLDNLKIYNGVTSKN